MPTKIANKPPKMVSANFSHLTRGTRAMIERAFYNRSLNGNGNGNGDGDEGGDCGCKTIVSDKYKPGYIGTYKSNAMRIADVLRASVGGSTQFGNDIVSDLGTREGQPGGVPRVPRNRF